MQHASGIITVVQEGRFRLSTGDGRSLLFTLDRGSRLEPQDLPRLIDRGRVSVAFTTHPHRRALVAHEIRMEGRR